MTSVLGCDMSDKINLGKHWKVRKQHVYSNKGNDKILHFLEGKLAQAVLREALPQMKPSIE